jgi:hypothetical protein
MQKRKVSTSTQSSPTSPRGGGIPVVSRGRSSRKPRGSRFGYQKLIILSIAIVLGLWFLTITLFHRSSSGSPSPRIDIESQFQFKAVKHSSISQCQSVAASSSSLGISNDVLFSLCDDVCISLPQRTVFVDRKQELSEPAGVFSLTTFLKSFNVLSRSDIPSDVETLKGLSWMVHFEDQENSEESGTAQWERWDLWSHLMYSAFDVFGMISFPERIARVIQLDMKGGELQDPEWDWHKQLLWLTLEHQYIMSDAFEQGDSEAVPMVYQNDLESQPVTCFERLIYFPQNDHEMLFRSPVGIDSFRTLVENFILDISGNATESAPKNVILFLQPSELKRFVNIEEMKSAAREVKNSRIVSARFPIMEYSIDDASYQGMAQLFQSASIIISISDSILFNIPLMKTGSILLEVQPPCYKERYNFQDLAAQAQVRYHSFASADCDTKDEEEVLSLQEDEFEVDIAMFKKAFNEIISSL